MAQASLPNSAMPLSSNRRFTRLEAARALEVPLSVIDALIEQKLLPPTLGARDIEAFFRDSLIRLFHAEATTSAEPEPREVEFELSQPFEDFKETFAKGRADLRRAPRYEPRRKVMGSFREIDFIVLEVSATGFRVRHEDTVRPGDEARVVVSIPDTKKTFQMRARVVWTTIAQHGNGPSFCMSGLRVTAGVDHLQQAMEMLRRGDADSKRRPSPANRTPPALVGLSDEDVAAIIRAYRKFSADPVEASRWYARARFAITDEKIKKAAPEKAADREEILGIWEFLERRVDIAAINSVVNWLKQTRSAAAV